jgi:hypothetical protein
MTASKRRRAKEEKKGRVQVGKLSGTKELSAEDARKVKGGTLLESVVKGKTFRKVEIHGTA